MIFFICSFKELNPNSIITHCTAGATKHHSYTTKRFIQSPEKKKTTTRLTSTAFHNMKRETAAHQVNF